jgi:hypothetical protein
MHKTFFLRTDKKVFLFTSSLFSTLLHKLMILTPIKSHFRIFESDEMKMRLNQHITAQHREYSINTILLCFLYVHERDERFGDAKIFLSHDIFSLVLVQERENVSGSGKR